MPSNVEAFRPGFGRNLAPLMVAIAGAGFFVWRLLPAKSPSRMEQVIFGWIAIPILGLAAAAYLRNILWRKPTVLLCSESLTVALPSFLGGASIPATEWGDVEQVGVVVKGRGMRIVEIRLKASQKSVSIPEWAIDIRANQLADKIQEHLAARGSRAAEANDANVCG